MTLILAYKTEKFCALFSDTARHDSAYKRRLEGKFLKTHKVNDNVFIAIGGSGLDRDKLAYAVKNRARTAADVREVALRFAPQLFAEQELLAKKYGVENEKLIFIWILEKQNEGGNLYKYNLCSDTLDLINGWDLMSPDTNASNLILNSLSVRHSIASFDELNEFVKRIFSLHSDIFPDYVSSDYVYVILDSNGNLLYGDIG